MASQVNPWAQGTVTDDPGLNERFGLVLGTAQPSAIWPVVGPPPAALGQNGDFAFRNDTPGTANQRMYIKAAGAWSALVI